MSVSFEDSVRDSFKNDHAKKYAETYLSETLTTWRDCEKSLSRTAFLLLITCVVTQLIHQGIANETSILEITITNFRIIQIFLPVLIAYLYSNLLSLAAESSMTETAFRKVFNVTQPELYNVHLERALYPANMTFFAGDRIKYAFPEKARTLKFVNLSTDARNYSLLLAPVAYEIYFFVVLFQKTGFLNAGLWVSFTLSVVLFLSAFIALVAAGTALAYLSN